MLRNGVMNIVIRTRVNVGGGLIAGGCDVTLLPTSLALWPYTALFHSAI
jgi:hypothetical protein